MLPPAAVPAPALLGAAHLYMRTSDGQIVLRQGDAIWATWEQPQTVGLGLVQDAGGLAVVFAQRDGPPLRATPGGLPRPIEGLGPGPVAVTSDGASSWVAGACGAQWCVVGPEGLVELGWAGAQDLALWAVGGALAVVGRTERGLTVRGLPDVPPLPPGCAPGPPAFDGAILAFVEQCEVSRLRRLALEGSGWRSLSTWDGLALEAARPLATARWTAATVEGGWLAVAPSGGTTTQGRAPRGATLADGGDAVRLGVADALATIRPSEPAEVWVDGAPLGASFSPIRAVAMSSGDPDRVAVAWLDEAWLHVHDILPAGRSVRYPAEGLVGTAAVQGLTVATSPSGWVVRWRVDVPPYGGVAGIELRLAAESGNAEVRTVPSAEGLVPQWCDGDTCAVPLPSGVAAWRCVADGVPRMAAGQVGGGACVACARDRWDGRTGQVLATVDVACTAER